MGTGNTIVEFSNNQSVQNNLCDLVIRWRMREGQVIL
jgi:hypothetical protein